MEAVRKRTELAARQAIRKRRIVREKLRRRDWRRHHDETVVLRREVLDATKASIQAAREAFRRGPLVPRRDLVGMHITNDEAVDKDPTYTPPKEANPTDGTYSAQRMRKPEVPVHHRLVRKDLLLRNGDRVCVNTDLLEGKEKAHTRSLIGTIKSIDCYTGFATVAGVNLIEQENPEILRQAGEDPVTAGEEPIPYHALRLIQPLPETVLKEDGTPFLDPVTKQPIYVPVDKIIDPGTMKLQYATADEPLSEEEERDAYNHQQDGHDDFFAEKPRASSAYRREDMRCEYFPFPSQNFGPRYRYLMPQRLRIPWPPNPVRSRQDEVADTVGASVKERTFQPTLLRPPMPEGVLDELRNRTSKYRTRHDEDYIARKEAEDADAAEQKAMMDDMKPRGARNIARTRRVGEKMQDQSGVSIPFRFSRTTDRLSEDVSGQTDKVEVETTGARNPARRSKVGGMTERMEIPTQRRKQTPAVKNKKPMTDFKDLTEEDTIPTFEDAQAKAADSTPPQPTQRESASYQRLPSTRSTGSRPHEEEMRKASVRKTKEKTHNPQKKDKFTGVDSKILEMLGKHMAAKRGATSTTPPPSIADVSRQSRSAAP